MKIIFLDIDGVLNCEWTKEKYQGFKGIDERLLKMYLDWRNQRDLKVVLSSTWRIPIGYGDFTGHLNEKGITWIDVTPHIPSAHRGLEIATWLNDHLDVTHFAILDDTCEMKPLSKHLVQTSYVHGLRPKDLRKVDKLLGYDETSIE